MTIKDLFRKKEKELNTVPYISGTSIDLYCSVQIDGEDVKTHRPSFCLETDYEDFAERLAAELLSIFEDEKPLTRYEMAASYFTARQLKEKPLYVPDMIRITEYILSDWQIKGIFEAEPGIYKAICNPYGAVCVATENGKLGVKPGEFEVLSWKAA